MFIRLLFSALLLLVLATAPTWAGSTPDRKEPAPGQASATPAQAATPLAALLKECRFDYVDAGPGTYTVTVPGKQVPHHKLFVATYEGLVLIGTVVAKKAEIPKVPDLAARLLRCNHDFDRVKVALDNDGDLVVRVDLTLRLLDAPELRTNIEQVAASADEILSLLHAVDQK